MKYVLNMLYAENNRLQDIKNNEMQKADKNLGVIASAERDLSELNKAITILEMVC